MNPDETQAGGSHYKDVANDGHQPWNWCEKIWPGGYEWNTCKYLCRLGKKGGREGLRLDLLKVQHYIQKMQHDLDYRQRQNPACGRADIMNAWPEFVRDTWPDSNSELQGCGPLAAAAVLGICNWSSTEDLNYVSRLVTAIQRRCFPEDYANFIQP